jgi:hypothetical protein
MNKVKLEIQLDITNELIEWIDSIENITVDTLRTMLSWRKDILEEVLKDEKNI